MRCPCTAGRPTLQLRQVAPIHQADGRRLECGEPPGNRGTTVTGSAASTGRRTRHSASPRPYGPKLGAHAPAPLRTASPRTAIRCPPRLHENAAFRDEKTETATGAESIHTQALNDVQRRAPPRPSRAARGGLRRQTSLRADPDTPVFLWQHAKAESLRQSGAMRKATATGERPHPHPQNRKLSGNVRPGASQGGRHPR